MNHAKTISRNDKKTKKSNATTTVQSTGRVQKLDETRKGRRGNTQGQTPVLAPCDVANAFLRATFLPRLAETETIQDCNKSKMERDFFKSLIVVEKKYNVSVQSYRELPFPYNISHSLTELRQHLKKTTDSWREVRLVHENNCTYFAQEERYDTGMTLYYIPVIPLHTILEQEDRLQVGELLLSVYAYLYRILKVPYYRNDDCYLFSTYETFEELMMEEDDKEIEDELKIAKSIGDIMQDKIRNEDNLQVFETRVNSFAPTDNFDRKCLKIAQQFFCLFQKYPDTAIDRKFSPLRLREELENDRVDVTLDNYVSFCSDLKGSLFNNICQYINDDLQDYGEIDEPTRFIPLDGRKIQDNDFDFENEVFENIDELISLWQYQNF